ncbi:MAG: hypothetical protein HY510_02870 [Acidobacteria bacterium]|nr:hypothetical protein [Acidobacteriota bacterium]
MSSHLLFVGMMFVVLPAWAKGDQDTCALLTRSEIEAVQGEAVVATKSSSPERRDLAVSQCFYTVAAFAKSISLEVTRRDPDGAAGRSPRDEWMRLFHPEAKESAPRGKGEKEKGQPQPVGGVGDEAFWTGDSVVGALYVLKGDAYFRISIGGGEEQSDRLEKSKKLAGKVLKRL